MSLFLPACILNFSFFQSLFLLPVDHTFLFLYIPIPSSFPPYFSLIFPTLHPYSFFHLLTLPPLMCIPLFLFYIYFFLLSILFTPFIVLYFPFLSPASCLKSSILSIKIYITEAKNLYAFRMRSCEEFEDELLGRWRTYTQVKAFNKSIPEADYIPRDVTIFV